jgi:hypothetical protein
MSNKTIKIVNLNKYLNKPILDENGNKLYYNEKPLFYSKSFLDEFRKSGMEYCNSLNPINFQKQYIFECGNEYQFRWYMYNHIQKSTKQIKPISSLEKMTVGYWLEYFNPSLRDTHSELIKDFEYTGMIDDNLYEVTLVRCDDGRYNATIQIDTHFVEDTIQIDENKLPPKYDTTL